MLVQQVNVDGVGVVGGADGRNSLRVPTTVKRPTKP